jgi:transcriptional regulator with XRE-family HTH domain
MDNFDTLTQLGANIRKNRLASGLSQEALALETGLDRTNLAFIDRGMRNVTVISLVKIARALNVNMQTLFEGIV